MTPTRALMVVLLLAFAGSLTGCATSSTSSSGAAIAASENHTIPASPMSPGYSGYKIGALDVLDISVFKVPELSKSVQVAASGTINLPLVGETQAANLTAQQLERQLTTKLGAKYLRDPQVTVYVKEYNSQRVIVEGAVKKPGVYPIKGSGSLMQAIASAEGVESKADSTIIIIRQSEGKRMAARFDMNQIRNGEADDPAILAGDTVVVGTSAMKEGFENLFKALPALGAFALLL